VKIVVGIMLAFVALAVAVSLAVTPLSQAKARNMDARNAGLARIAEAEARAAEARAQQAAAAAAAAAAERAAISPWLAVAGRVAVVVGVVAVVAAGGGVAVVVGSVAYSQSVQNKQLAKLPVTKQIADRAFVFQAEDGRYWLLDSMTGRRALLSSAADVDQLRAGIVREQIIIQELGKTAVEISRAGRGGGDGRAAVDWLFSDAMRRIGTRLDDPSL
jgi:hypothetical protein